MVEPSSTDEGSTVTLVTSRSQALTLAVHAVLAVVIIVSATVLLGLHDLDASSYTALIGTALGLLGGSAGTLAVVGFQQAADQARLDAATAQLVSQATPPPPPS